MKKGVIVGLVLILILGIISVFYSYEGGVSGNVVEWGGCEFEVFQDKNFEKGFSEAMSYLPIGERCSMPVQGQNPYWDIQEICTNQYFCKNLPQPKNTNPFTLVSADGKKELISYGNGHLRFKIDTSFEENKGCRIFVHPECLGIGDKNTCESNTHCDWLGGYGCFDNTLHWWVHYGIVTSFNGRGLGVTHPKDYESLIFNMSIKINEEDLRYHCKNNEVYPFYPNTSYHEPGAGWFAYFELNNISPVNGPEMMMINVPAQFHFNGTTYAVDTMKIVEDTFGNAIVLTNTDTEQLEILKQGGWANYNFDLKEYLEEVISLYNQENTFGYNINLNDYTLAKFTFASEHYAGGFYEDVEIRGLSLIAKTTNRSLCNERKGNYSSWYYSSGFEKAFSRSGHYKVNNEWWYVGGNENSANGWVWRPFYYDVEVPEEICNTLDDDLDNQIDEGCDDDQDSYADASMICNDRFYTWQYNEAWAQYPMQQDFYYNEELGWFWSNGDGWVWISFSCNTNSGDSNDNDGAVYPGAPEPGSIPVCAEENWEFSLSPTTCPLSGEQTKSWTKIGECEGGIVKSIETISCDPDIPTCINFTYSNWSVCKIGDVQNRSILSSLPDGCQGGNPVVSQSCNYTQSTTPQTQAPAQQPTNQSSTTQNQTQPSTSPPSSQPQSQPSSGSPAQKVNYIIVNDIGEEIDIYEGTDDYEGDGNDEEVDEGANNDTISDDNKKSPGKVKMFFVRIICKLSNLFNKEKYQTCLDRYV